MLIIKQRKTQDKISKMDTSLSHFLTQLNGSFYDSVNDEINSHGNKFRKVDNTRKTTAPYDENAFNVNDESHTVLRNVSSLMETVIDEKMKKYIAVLRNRVEKRNTRKNDGQNYTLNKCKSRKRQRSSNIIDISVETEPSSPNGAVAAVRSAQGSFEMRCGSRPMMRCFGKVAAMDTSQYNVADKVGNTVDFVEVDIPVTYKCIMETVIHERGGIDFEIGVEVPGNIKALVMVRNAQVTVMDYSVNLDRDSMLDIVNKKAHEALKETLRMICGKLSHGPSDVISCESPRSVATSHIS